MGMMGKIRKSWFNNDKLSPNKKLADQAKNKFEQVDFVNRRKMRFKHLFSVVLALVTLLGCIYPWGIKPVKAAVGPYCQFAPAEVEAKEKLFKTYLEKDPAAIQGYEAILQKHTQMLQLCRSQTWPEEQAIWLRLYPCDITPGSIDYVLDRIVNLGYNKVHLEVFYDGQVLLPPGDNPTPWTSVVRSPGAENIDLLQQTIDKGKQRGLKVYAWLFTMNFGYTYAQLADRQEALARNGKGSNSLTFVHDRSQAFIDPYSPQAQTDYYNLVQAVLKRNPDGILFDYIRYPQGTGGESYVDNVRDLWIHGKSSLNALYDRASNEKGLAVIKKYISTGSFTTQDLQSIDKQYPKEQYPKWQGSRDLSKATLQSQQQALSKDLWFFSVAHAAQGVIDFLSFAAKPAQDQGLAAGAVFFPEGNRLIKKTSFDSRLQPWDKFPANIEWHPMSYAVCGDKADCIAEQVKKVLKIAPDETTVIPALAGAWGKTYRNHASLETQIESLRRATPEINSISHFSYSWQEPDLDLKRKSCNFL